MTCIVVLKVASYTNESLGQTVLAGSLETNIIGTTAGLEKGYRYSIEQLLYGLMLPSGNDASLALAVWAGRLLYLRKNGLNRNL
jgi:D-alanyl-D-alanine carboxypeptidase (penicillin-binding protein 5/6)